MQKLQLNIFFVIVLVTGGCSPEKSARLAHLEDMREWAETIQKASINTGTECIVSFRGHEDMFLCQLEGPVDLNNVMHAAIRDFCNDNNLVFRNSLEDAEGSQVFVCISWYENGKMFISWREDGPQRSYAFFSICP